MATQAHEQHGSAWTSDELKHFEERLLDERKRAVAQMAQFDDQLGKSTEDADGDLSTWRFHMADEGTDTYDREQKMMLASREGRLLWLIDQALRRLYQHPERFGVCDECHSRMSYERLDTLPYAMTCINCKQDWEGAKV
jgi:RNA polymerase-binding transcription factor DksA